MNPSIPLLIATSLAFHPVISGDGPPARCNSEVRPIDPVVFSRLTGIIVAPNADVRIDVDDDCETTDADVLRWLEGEAARPFLDRRTARFISYCRDRYGWAVCGDDVVPGDLNANDVVDQADLVALLRQLGQRSEHATSPAVDVSGNGIIDLDDLAQLLDRWGDRGDGLSWCNVVRWYVHQVVQDDDRHGLGSDAADGP